MNFINSLINFKNILIRRLYLQEIRSKLKASAKSIIKFIVMIMYICGLIYQVHIIYEQYMSGETIIRLEISEQIDESHPAVTMFPKTILY